MPITIFAIAQAASTNMPLWFVEVLSSKNASELSAIAKSEINRRISVKRKVRQQVFLGEKKLL
ncbi:MAG: hypothetical protein KG029_09180 [Bacteroidetes bacterium]|nr:hypothetical protein [Bacteroidota bacterium]